MSCPSNSTLSIHNARIVITTYPRKFNQILKPNLRNALHSDLPPFPLCSGACGTRTRARAARKRCSHLQQPERLQKLLHRTIHKPFLRVISLRVRQFLHVDRT